MHTADAQGHAVGTGFLVIMAVTCPIHCTRESNTHAAGLHHAEALLTQSGWLHRLGVNVSLHVSCSRQACGVHPKT